MAAFTISQIVTEEQAARTAKAAIDPVDEGIRKTNVNIAFVNYHRSEVNPPTSAESQSKQAEGKKRF